MKRNIADLPAVLDLAKRLGASQFSLSNVEPYTGDMEKEILYGSCIFEPIPAAGAMSPRMDADFVAADALAQVARSFPGAISAFSPAAGRSGLCPFLHRRSASVRWDGRVGPCLPLLHAHTLCINGHTRSWPDFTLGSLVENNLSAIWNDPVYCAFRRKLDEFAFAPCTTCNSCDLPDENGEDCFGNLHPACGGCLWSQGFIQCP
jgi:MoaA/NifB/PqqE/SkfB family radical SAM enzyme